MIMQIYKILTITPQLTILRIIWHHQDVLRVNYEQNTDETQSVTADQNRP